MVAAVEKRDVITAVKQVAVAQDTFIHLILLQIIQVDVY